MKKISIFLFFVIFYTSSFGQAKCGFDEKLQELLRTNPEYARIHVATEQSIKNYIAAHPPGITNLTTVVYNIPVVLHVMHTGGAIGSPYNPTDAQLTGFITYLNQVYAGTYPGMEAPVEGGGVVNLELQFVLAQRTPSCGATNGIDRVNASSIPNYTSFGVNAQNSNGCSDLTLKDFARWNPADYYNIWIVNKIDGNDGTVGQFIAGYAYFAGSPANVDGTVMLATQSNAGNKVLPHEIGHAFNLYHPFEGSNLNTQCPANANCNTDGDQVCDTDPITNNVNASNVYDFTCRSGTNTCTGGAYTRNTEKNFMSYTNCFTLFTNGQKARVVAAMTSSPSRISLGASTAATPCGTVVNFVAATDAKTENNAGTVIDCRKYTDYTYQMSIGAAPTANATVTFSYSGTAVKGQDYDVTTGNTLVFTSGSAASQTFTIRVYDDAAIEPAETAILNFTVSGGGASVGITIPTFTLTINDNDVAPIAGGNLSGGVGTYNIALNIPFRGTQFDARSQILYTKAELTALGFSAGNITSIGFNVVTKASTQAYSGFTLKLKNTSTTALSSGAFESGATPVYGPVAYSTIAGVNTLPITSFFWDGNSNLLVDICFDNTTATGNDDIQGATSVANTYFDRQSTNATPGCSIANSVFVFGTSARPIYTFGLTVPTTPISTALNSNKTAYLGPFEDVYFYDGSGNIMARIKNLTAFDYGCTQLIIDRAGSTSAQFWNTNTANYLLSKSFKVIPTNNTTTGSYQITFYYTAAEVAGWQTATGQTWASSTMQVAKVSNGFFVPDVTSGAPHFADVALVTGTKGTLGSDYTIRGDFSSTGFSGFGVGVANTTYTWTGASSTNWNTAGNWSPASVPLATDNAIIPNLANKPLLSATSAIYGINIAGSAFVDITGQSFTINGPVTSTSTITGSPTSNLIIAGAAGTLNFTQTSATTRSLNNLTLNSGSSATLGNALDVFGTIALTTGSLNLNAQNLTLKSNTTNTARIANLTGSTLTGATNVTVERWIPVRGGNPLTGGRAYRLLAPTVNTTGTMRANWMEGGMVGTGTTNPVPLYGTHITGASGNTNFFDQTTSNAPSAYFTTNAVTPTYTAIGSTQVGTNIATLNALKGYFLYIRGDRSVSLSVPLAANMPTTSTTLRTTGTLLTGDQSFTGTLLTGDGNMNLVTNPYASPISWNLIYNDAVPPLNTNLKNYYTLWDPNVGTRGGFVTVTEGGTVSILPPVGPAGTTAANINIQPGQAFFVTSNGASAPTLTIKEKYKSTVNNNGVFKPGGTPDESLRTTLYFTEPNGFRRAADGVIAIYDKTYSASIDANDAYEINNWDENIAISRGGKHLAIESRPVIGLRDTIALFMNNMKQQAYEFEFSPASFSNKTLKAELIDNFLGTRTLLSVTDTVRVPFTITSNPASAATDRFMVVFGPAKAFPIDVLTISAEAKNNGIQVDWTAKTETDMDRYELERSLNGTGFNRINTIAAIGNSQAAYSYNWLDPAPLFGSNYYRVKAINKSGLTKYTDIVKVNFGGSKPDVTVFPNPVDGQQINIQLTDIEKGTYNVSVINKLGQVVYQSQVQHGGGSAIIAVTPPSVLASGLYEIVFKKENYRINKTFIKN
jgi:hypothetical protein